MIDFSALLLDPIYDELGVEASLEAAGTVTLTVLDKTEGVILESPNGPLQMATAKPAACVRMSELETNEILREDLKGAAITFNGNTWKIVATQPKPVPSGVGELYLILQSS
jgi:hypothetical protein